MIGNRKHRLLAFSLILMLLPVLLSGQSSNEYIRKGNKLYKKSEYAGSETMYRRAAGQEKTTPDAGFNTGDALYKQGKYQDAAGEFEKSVSGYNDRARQADSYYNNGIALLKDKKYKESIEAYINSLKINPDNIQAKYNLAYAQDQLKKQEEQQKQQQQQQQNKDQNQNQENKDKNNKQDQNKQDQDKQDQNQKQKDQQDQQQQNQNGADQQQQASMSREDAQRLLDALAAYEKQTQDKVQRDKTGKAKVRVIKNW